MPDPPLSPKVHARLRTYLDVLLAWEKDTSNSLSPRESLEFLEDMAAVAKLEPVTLELLAKHMGKFSDGLSCKQFLLKLAGEAQKMEEE